MKLRFFLLPTTLFLAPLSALAAGEVFQDCPKCPKMVEVPAGSFMMGSRASERGRDEDEGPVHRVRVARFAVSIYEIRFADWDLCVAEGGCDGYRPEDKWGRGRHPVINVSWDDVQAYLKYLSAKTGHTYRLLSEAEWEYAARAGTTTPFYTGWTISTKQANYHGNYTYGSGVKGVYRERTTQVGSFPPNAFGLHDMHGNVVEWVQDCWNGNYQGAPNDGSAWDDWDMDCGRRVVRGGSWDSHPRNLRSADRFGNPSGDRNYLVGFRVARTLTP